ncbi:MAG: shikimate kinase [Pirellulales bacterium]|nr:shikimate kinase [Pirellulales bacterium]
MHLALVGYRGTGKTTVARLLAERLGWPAYDSDDEIERAAHRSIAEIFAADGEPTFRQMEMATIARLCQLERAVLSVGGGSVLRAENRAAMRADGRVVWLQASAATLLARIEQDATTNARRPNLTARGGLDEIVQLLAAREPLYRQTAHLVVDTEGKEPATVADEIVARLRPELEGTGQT